MKYFQSRTRVEKQNEIDSDNFAKITKNLKRCAKNEHVCRLLRSFTDLFLESLFSHCSY